MNMIFLCYPSQSLHFINAQHTRLIMQQVCYVINYLWSVVSELTLWQLYKKKTTHCYHTIANEYSIKPCSQFRFHKAVISEMNDTSKFRNLHINNYAICSILLDMCKEIATPVVAWNLFKLIGIQLIIIYSSLCCPLY